MTTNNNDTPKDVGLAFTDFLITLATMTVEAMAEQKERDDAA